MRRREEEVKRFDWIKVKATKNRRNGRVKVGSECKKNTKKW